MDIAQNQSPSFPFSHEERREGFYYLGNVAHETENEVE